MVGRRRTQLSDDIRTESKQLLDKRAADLVIIEEEANKRLEVILHEIESRRREVAVINSETSSCSAGLEALNIKTKEHNEQLAAIAGIVEVKKQELRGLEQQVNALLQQVDSLKAEKSAFITDVNELLSQKQVLAEFNSQLQQTNDNIAAKCRQIESEHTKSLQVLESKQANIQFTMKIKAAEQETIREDLVIRTRVLNEREQNLKIREAKVAQGEASISRNASLLDL